MKSHRQELWFETPTRRAFLNITPEVKAAVAKSGVVSVLVEGGGEVLGSFLDAGIADKVYAFYAPILIGGNNAAGIGGTGAEKVAKAMRFKEISIQRFGDNILVISSSPGQKKVRKR